MVNKPLIFVSPKLHVPSPQSKTDESKYSQRPAVVGRVRVEDKRSTNLNARGHNLGGLEPDDGLEDAFDRRERRRGVADRGVAGVGASPHRGRTGDFAGDGIGFHDGGGSRFPVVIFVHLTACNSLSQFTLTIRQASPR